MDDSAWQVLELGPHPLREVDMEELDDQVIILESRQAVGKSILFQIDVSIGSPVVLGVVHWCVHFCSELRHSDCTLKGVWSRLKWAGTSLTRSSRARATALLLVPPVGC